MHEIKDQAAERRAVSGPMDAPGTQAKPPTRRNCIRLGAGRLAERHRGGDHGPYPRLPLPGEDRGDHQDAPKHLTRHSAERHPRGRGVQFDAPPNAALVMADGGGVNAAGNYTYGGYLTRVGGRLNALAITCPHLGCSYGLDPNDKRFLCPCHGSIFDLEGKVLHGPAANPLSHLTWRPGDQPDVVLVDGVNQAG